MNHSDTGADLGALIDGFRRDAAEGVYRCLYCEHAFTEGMIYEVADGRADARMAVARHVAQAHGGPFAALLKRGTAGLPAVQEKVLQLLYEGNTDDEIAKALGGKSASTVRNHRFTLRRRESEARAFLALSILLDRRRPGTPRFVEYPAAVAGLDERAVVSEAEAKAVEARNLEVLAGGGLRLTGWPKRQKDKLVLLRRIAGLFEAGRSYTETEVNAILGPVWHDYVDIRRYLIEYRFLDRMSDCSQYWRLQG
jgi:hypothetical protein